MSKAEELARHVIHEWEDYALGGARVHEVVSELRRLAQVEAEHAALLKAISDAEPVAWIRPSGKAMLEAGGYCTVYLSSGMSNHSEPLYTLNGINP